MTWTFKPIDVPNHSITLSPILKLNRRINLSLKCISFLEDLISGFLREPRLKYREESS